MKSTTNRKLKKSKIKQVRKGLPFNPGAREILRFKNIRQ